MLFDLIIQIHYMQDIQQLTFVFVQTFYLYIEDRSWIYFYTVVLFDVSCKTLFVLELDRHEFFQSLFVIQPFLQSAHLG